MSGALHEQDHPWATCPSCRQPIKAHVLVEYVMEKPAVRSIDPVEVDTQSQRDGSPWAGEWVLRGLRIEHACGQLSGEVLEQDPLGSARLSRGGVIRRDVRLFVGEEGPEQYRPRVCMCGHVEAIHVARQIGPPGPREPDSRPCTGAHCDCSDYIERDT